MNRCRKAIHTATRPAHLERRIHPWVSPQIFERDSAGGTLLHLPPGPNSGLSVRLVKVATESH